MSIIGAEVMGEIGTYSVNELQFRVKIMDVKRSSGKTALLVTPCDGKGVTWVDANKVTFSDEDADHSYLFIG